jgi:hypothetical protein
MGGGSLNLIGFGKNFVERTRRGWLLLKTELWRQPQEVGEYVFRA